MQPTDILMNEHRTIEQVLDYLEKTLDECRAGQTLDIESARQALTFFRDFADGYHHAKEEAELFPLMEASGFSGGCSPVAVMRREHELGRLYVQGMAAALDPAAAGDSVALERFIEHGTSYAKLLREHIRNEDICLFPAANHRLTDQDQEQLRTAFEKIDEEEVQRRARDTCLKIAAELAERVGPPRAASSMPEPGSSGRCAHH